MNHSLSQPAAPHEANRRLIKLERKIEGKKLLQLGMKLTQPPTPRNRNAGGLASSAKAITGNDTPGAAAKRKWLPKAEITDGWPTHALQRFP
jgi:hypothetical protein